MRGKELNAQEERIRAELNDLAEDFRHIAEAIENIADSASHGELVGMKMRGDIAQVKIRLGQAKFRLKLA